MYMQNDVYPVLGTRYIGMKQRASLRIAKDSPFFSCA